MGEIGAPIEVTFDIDIALAKAEYERGTAPDGSHDPAEPSKASSLFMRGRNGGGAMKRRPCSHPPPLAVRYRQSIA